MAAVLTFLHLAVLTWHAVMSTTASDTDTEVVYTKMKTRSISDCEVVPLILHVKPPHSHKDRCMTAKVLTFGCQGTCSSYSRIHEKPPYQIQRECSCCEPIRYGIHLATIQCSDGTELRAPLKFAVECDCRPCSQRAIDLILQRLHPGDKQTPQLG